MKKIAWIVISLSFFSISQAAQVSITAIPTEWILENEAGGYINAYYTGTSCPSGRLLLDGSITEQDKNRFWSTIMTAKVSGMSVTVWYDSNLPDCPLRRFRLNANN